MDEGFEIALTAYQRSNAECNKCPFVLGPGTFFQYLQIVLLDTVGLHYAPNLFIS